MTGLIFDGGNLDVFVVFGVDILDEGNKAANGDVLVFFNLVDVNGISKIDVSSGEVIDEVLRRVDI